MAFFSQPSTHHDLLRRALRLAVAAVLAAVLAVELDAVAVFLLLRSIG